MNAYPTLRQIQSPYGAFVTSENGMTLRDYFAAKAMQAMLNDTTIYENVAKYAYKMADEMMKARDNNG